MKGVALKVTFNDGGAAPGGLGFSGPCSDATMKKNVRGPRPGRYCSTAGCACHDWFHGGCQGPRPAGHVCNESGLFSRQPWRFGGGGYHSGPRVGEWMPLRQVEAGDLVVLTTVLPGTDASERVIFGCYKLKARLEVADLYEGFYLESDGSLQVRLSLEQARGFRFWDYYVNSDGSRFWGSGLHQYLDGGQVERIMGEMQRRLGVTKATTR